MASRTAGTTLGGAATGAAAGSVLGPAGIAGGAVVGGLAGYLMGKMGDDADADTVARAQALAERYEREYTLPDYDKTPFSPEEYKLLNTYVPEFVRFVQEKHPQLVTEQASAAAKSAQNQALEQYGQLAQSGNDAQSIADTEKARFVADSDAASRRNRLLQAYGQRATGGQALLSNVAGSQQDEQNARMGALEAASGASQRRMSALNQYAGLAGNIRSQNTNVEQANNSVINAFNQRNSQNLQTYENNRANLANQAQLHNQQQSQAVSNLNTGLRNQAQQFNMNRNDKIMENTANAKNQRLGGATQQGNLVNALQSQQANNQVAAMGGAVNAGLGAAQTYGQSQAADRSQALQEFKAGATYDPSTKTYKSSGGSNLTSEINTPDDDIMGRTV